MDPGPHNIPCWQHACALDSSRSQKVNLDCFFVSFFQKLHSFVLISTLPINLQSSVVCQLVEKFLCKTVWKYSQLWTTFDRQKLGKTNQGKPCNKQTNEDNYQTIMSNTMQHLTHTQYHATPYIRCNSMHYHTICVRTLKCSLLLQYNFVTWLLLVENINLVHLILPKHVPWEKHW